MELGIKATAVCSEKLQQLLKDIDKVWNNLISFMSLAALTVRLKTRRGFPQQNVIVVCKVAARGVLSSHSAFLSCKVEMQEFVPSGLKLSVRKPLFMYERDVALPRVVLIQVIPSVSADRSDKGDSVK